jgi:hypothetical protein
MQKALSVLDKNDNQIWKGTHAESSSNVAFGLIRSI